MLLGGSETVYEQRGALWPFVLSAGIGAALIAILLALRRRLSPLVSGVLFSINTAAVLVAITSMAASQASAGEPWTPFQPHKLGAITVPLLMPQPVVGLANIAAYVVAALVQLHGFP